MDRARSGLILLLAGVAGVMYLWSSAKKKQPPTSQQETEQNRARQPLEVLYSGPIDDVEVDIIAIHGLGSNVDWSWTWKDGNKCVHWLQDSNMLPKKVPKSRTMVYNYESRWHKDAPKTRIQLCGEELIHSVHSFRGEGSKRPIVFIGHSLGGNVIVDALLYANDEDKYRYLPEATVGVVFLGTPLRGTKWQPFLDSLAQSMGLVGSHRGITEGLRFDGPELRDKLHRFCHLRNTLSLPVSCFHELYETDYGRRLGISGVAKGMIVEEASACIPGVDRYALQTDHLKINKYQGPTDRAFLSVSGVISEMCANSKDVVTRRRHPRDIITNRDHALKQKPDAGNCLRDLFLTDPLEDKKALKRKKGDRACGTCEWILGTEELTTWLGSDGQVGGATQVLWLHGNPGTGKSTMAMFLTEELATAFSQTEGRTLAYFFCDSGFDTRKTATSVIRGLLLQLVQQHPRLLDYLLSKYEERGAELFKSFDALWTIFMDAAADQNTGRKYCIIDALDECDAESQGILLRQLQEAFQSRNAPPNIRILVTSRPYPEIREYMQEFAKRDLASFPQAKQDIDRCIEERITDLTKRKHYTDKVKRQVTDILRDKAEGTFLWIGLACKELEDWPSNKAVSFLQGMPRGLDSLYKTLLKTALKQGGQDNEIHRILSFVAVCLRPLSVLELSEACQLYQDEDDMETRMQFTSEKIASCRLMVIIQDEKVLLLHQSVKDFLVGAGGGHLIDEPKAHADLAYRCIDLYIEQFKIGGQSDIDFLEYATQEWPSHARMADSQFEVKNSQAEFFEVESPCRESWIRAYRRSVPGGIPSQFSILHVAARWGVPALIHHVARIYTERQVAEELTRFIHYVDESGATPLECAINSGHITVASVLLGLGASIDARVVKAAAGNPWNGKEVMALLLEQRGHDISITEEVVSIIAGRFDKEVMALLLEQRGYNISITEEVVKAAAGNWGNGREVMALLLEQRGYNISITEEVVKAAAGNGGNGKRVMALLLEQRGHDISIMEEVVKAAAGNWGNGREVMALLLEQRGHDISITEEVVKAAAGNGGNGKEVMALLLEQQGHNISITEEVVKAAVGNEDNGEEVMALLLEQRGHDISITEEVVSIIAGRFDKEVMALLLEQRGHDISITEEVVKAAAGNEDNGEEVMALLLEQRGHDISITEEVVKAAAGNLWNGKRVMALLLEQRGHDISITVESEEFQDEDSLL